MSYFIFKVFKYCGISPDGERTPFDVSLGTNIIFVSLFRPPFLGNDEPPLAI